MTPAMRNPSRKIVAATMLVKNALSEMTSQSKMWKINFRTTITEDDWE